MSLTTFALGDALAVQRWSDSLAIEAAKAQYFEKFIGVNANNLIVLKTDLNKGAGEKVVVGLRMKLTAPGAEGDNIIAGVNGPEEALVFHNDAVFIDQLRKSTKSKGKMTEQRVPYDLRKEGRDALATWWAEEMDEEIFFYLSGARGTSTAAHSATNWTGRANNAFAAPDADHLMYAGAATAKANLAATDIIKLSDIERFVAKSELTDPMIQPFTINGEKKYVCLMHTLQAFQIRTATSEQDWLAIQKAAGVRGDANRIYSGAMGEYADVILHKHRNVVTFDDYGTTSNTQACRTLFLGAQAGLMAYGQKDAPGRYNWFEELDDRGNALAITAGTIFGVKKARFNSKDFGVIAMDCALNRTLV